jgi:hypothetical protein
MADEDQGGWHCDGVWFLSVEIEQLDLGGEGLGRMRERGRDSGDSLLLDKVLRWARWATWPWKPSSGRNMLIFRFGSVHWA